MITPVAEGPNFCERTETHYGRKKWEFKDGKITIKGRRMDYEDLMISGQI